MSKKNKIILVSIIAFIGVIIFIVVNFNNTTLPFNNKTNSITNESSSTSTTTFLAYIIEKKGNHLLIEPAKNEVERNSSNKISIYVEDSEKYEVGEKVKITYNGNIMESYPAKINLIDIQKCEDTKLVAMYKTVIDYLYNTDVALNSDAKYIALDLNGMPNLLEKSNIDSEEFNVILTDEEKETLLNYYKKYNDNVINADFNKLKEDGLFNEEYLYIEGILMYISKIEQVSSNKVLLGATKYKSGLGAIFLGLELNYQNGTWTVETTSFAIS